MNYEVKLTQKNVFRLLLQRTLSIQNGKMLLLSGLILIILGFVLLFHRQQVTYAVIIFVLGVLAPCSIPFNVYRQARMTVASGMPDLYTINETQITYSHNGHVMNIPWNKIFRINEYPRGLLLDLSQNQITLIPKDDMGEEYQSIRNAIAQYAQIIQKSGSLFSR